MCLRNAVEYHRAAYKMPRWAGAHYQNIAKSCVDHQALQLGVMAQLILSDIDLAVS